MKEINGTMLHGFFAKTRIFGQHSKCVNVSIDMCADPVNKAVWFICTNNRIDVYTGVKLSEAIDTYNKIVRTAKDGIPF